MSSSSASVPPVGIDLGTTFSVVATLDAQGRPFTVQNSEGDITTPSVVMFDRSSVVTGKEAVKLASYEPEAVAAYAKRDIGSPLLGKLIHGRRFPPEVVQSFVLKKLKEDAALKIGPFEKAVVTVPAYFNEPRRKATQDAGHLAGLDVLDIINEPTAAAIAYGVEQGFLTGQGASREAETVLVYDLGGGTFDVTLMRIEGNDYTALSTAGDVYLGGIDWDRRIIDYVAARFEEDHGVDPRQDPAALARLGREAEEAKRALTARDNVILSFEHEGHFLRVNLTRDEFEMLTADLLERTRFTTRKVLTEAKMDWPSVTRLLLVGGSSRMPMVHRILEEESGLTPDRSLAADEAVAHGAAVYAGFLLSGQTDAVQFGVGNITNVSSHDLGVLGTEPATGRPRRKIIIPHNTPLPSKKGQRFATEKASQQSVRVQVVEGGDDSGHNATPIGACVVTDLPPDLPKHTPVDVYFQYEANGRLTVSAVLPEANQSATLRIERESGLSDEELEAWSRRIEAGDLLAEEEPAAAVFEDEPAKMVFDDSDLEDDKSEPPEMIFEDEPASSTGSADEVDSSSEVADHDHENVDEADEEYEEELEIEDEDPEEVGSEVGSEVGDAPVNETEEETEPGEEDETDEEISGEEDKKAAGDDDEVSFDWLKEIPAEQEPDKPAEADAGLDDFLKGLP